jgi:D-alanine-D-alanine ligase-like ATP-grasp enzyme
VYARPVENRAGSLMPTPEFTRYAREAAAAIGATFEDLDGGRGYLWRVTRDGRSVLGGGGSVCAYPVNSAVAWTISRDKAHTKAVLTSNGIPVIPGGLFFAHGLRAAQREPGREIADAIAFAGRLGFPVFCKPNTGSRGDFAEIIADAAALFAYATRIAALHESLLVEPVIDGAEHRVFVQDGRVVFHATKAAPSVTGDGKSTLAQLVAAMDRNLASGVSATAIAGRSPDDTPAPGERIVLAGRRNLSAAGGVDHVSETAPSGLASMAIAAVAALGLRVGAVDLFDQSSAGEFSDLVVIEVNGNPGLRTLEIAGRNDLIRAIWMSMYEECLRRESKGS